MGHGTWYYSLGVFLEIVDVFVRSEFQISSWRGARVDVRTYLLGGAIDSSEANGIICDPKLELESSRFTFDLVHLSYESVDVVVGENWLLRHKAEMELVGFTPRRRIGFRMELVQGATPICEGSCRLTSLERQEVWNDCRSCKVRVGSNGNLLWEASVLLGRKKAKTVFRMLNRHIEVYGYAFWVNQCTNGFHGVNKPGGVQVARKDDHGVTEGREYVHEVFQQRGSGPKRKLTRCGRNQMGNEPILAMPEGADDFVVLMKDCMANVTSIWRDVRTLAIEESYTTKYSIHPGADTLLCGFRLTNRWLSMKKDIASCGSKYLAYLEVEVEYQGSSGLLLQPELPEWKWERITKDIVFKITSGKETSSSFDVYPKDVTFLDIDFKPRYEVKAPEHSNEVVGVNPRPFSKEDNVIHVHEMRNAHIVSTNRGAFEKT
ncbi:hypothetical protein Tco_0531377 [Tanacetum coccineum]